MDPGSEMSSYFLKNLKKCFLEPAMHNTKFIVGVDRQEFKCNGTVLAVISSVFRDMLFNQTKQRKAHADNRCAEVELRNITPIGFSALVRFAFSQDPEISPETVVEVLHAAAQFRVHLLHKLAVDYLSFILKGYSADYLVIYLEQATRLGLRFVVSQCMNSLCAGGPKYFLESKQFTEFPAEFISLLLSCDELPIEEEDIWKCVLRWAKVQAKLKNKNLVDLLKLVYHRVRFPLMTTKYFSSEVVPTGVLTQKETLDLFCYLTYPEGKPETKPFSSDPRLLWNNVVISRFKKCSDSTMNHVVGQVDCIGIKVNRECQLIAVGTFVGQGLSKCMVCIYEVEGKYRELVDVIEEQKIWRDTRSPEPARIALKAPVTLRPEQVYEIEVDQSGPPSNRLKEGKPVCAGSHNGVKITFCWQKAEVKSLTTLKKGNIPCIWVQVLSGK